MVMTPSQPVQVTQKVRGNLERVRIDQSKANSKGDSATVATAMITWKNELEAACDSARLFDEDKTVPVEIVIAVQQFEPAALDYEHHVTATYKLIDRRTGVVFKEVKVTSTGHDSTFYGVERYRSSLSQSVSLNIESFLRAFSRG